MLVRISIAAEMQGVSPSTIRRWEKDEQIPSAERTKGGHRRFKLPYLIGEEERKRGKNKRVIGLCTSECS